MAIVSLSIISSSLSFRMSNLAHDVNLPVYDMIMNLLFGLLWRITYSSALSLTTGLCNHHKIMIFWYNFIYAVQFLFCRCCNRSRFERCKRAVQRPATENIKQVIHKHEIHKTGNGNGKWEFC